VGLRVLLLQHQEDGPRIIHYASYALSDVERQYSQRKKEAYAAVWVCKKFHLYLFVRIFMLITDCKALEFIFGNRSKPSLWIERCVLQLQAYHFKVLHKPGKSNLADLLSRMLPLKKCKTPPATNQVCNKFEQHLWHLVAEAVPTALQMEIIQEESTKDPLLTELKQCLKDDNWPKDLWKYELLKDELCEADGFVLRGNCTVIPKRLQQQVLELAHEGHVTISSMKRQLSTKVWWLNMDADVEKWVDTCHGCQVTAQVSSPESVICTKRPSRPWEVISCDFMGQLPSKHHLLVVMDYYSRFPLAEVVMHTTA
jgi:hypothetical protein